jgi:hypothetical protein
VSHLVLGPPNYRHTAPGRKPQGPGAGVSKLLTSTSLAKYGLGSATAAAEDVLKGRLPLSAGPALKRPNSPLRCISASKPRATQFRRSRDVHTAQDPRWEGPPIQKEAGLGLRHLPDTSTTTTAKAKAEPSCLAGSKTGFHPSHVAPLCCAWGRNIAIPPKLQSMKLGSLSHAKGGDFLAPPDRARLVAEADKGSCASGYFPASSGPRTRPPAERATASVQLSLGCREPWRWHAARHAMGSKPWPSQQRGCNWPYRPPYAPSFSKLCSPASKAPALAPGRPGRVNQLCGGQPALAPHLWQQQPTSIGQPTFDGTALSHNRPLAERKRSSQPPAAF